MIQHIHILGATGSGTTTHGKALAKNLGFGHFDNDNYVFESKNNQFTKPRQAILRDTMLLNDLRSTPAWVLSGAICGWGDFVIRYFDLVIFLRVSLEERMKRLEAREEKLGRKVEDPTHPKYKTYKKFMKWAAAYDTGSHETRSLAQHEDWIRKLSCPVLRVEGDKSVEENLAIIIKYIKLLESKRL